MRRVISLFTLVLLMLVVSGYKFYQPGMEGPPYVRSTALESSHVLKPSAGNLFTITIVWHSTAARWLMLFDATSAPGDGAVSPAWCAPVSLATDPADGFRAFDFTSHAPFFGNGIVAVISTNAAGCFSKTADGANDAFFAQVQ